MQRGAASAGADLEGPVTQEEAPRAATEQTEEEGPTPRVVEAHESDGAGAPPVAEAGIEAEVPGTSEVEVVEASATGPVARDSEMEVGQPLVPPLAQGLPPSLESAWEVEVSGGLLRWHFLGKGGGKCRGSQHRGTTSSDLR